MNLEDVWGPRNNTDAFETAFLVISRPPVAIGGQDDMPAHPPVACSPGWDGVKQN